jgi:hypothetical protein
MPVTKESLDDIVKYAQGSFITAKSDGKLEAGEVVQIAVLVSQKLAALGQLNGSDKKSIVLFCLKRGLDAAGGVGELPGLAGASAEVRKAVEDQLLSAASSAIDAMVAVARGEIDLRKKDGWKACLPLCLSVASAVAPLLPKEAGIVKQALEFAQAQVAAQVPPAIQESETKEVVAPVPVPVPVAVSKDTSPETQPETAPSQPASAEASPPQIEVKFE